jgi:FkbM family methyltransferase
MALHATPQLEFVKQYLPYNPIVVSAGGNSTEKMLQLFVTWPQGCFHIFEAHTNQLDDLTQKTARLPSIFIYPIALSDMNGFRPFYACTDNSIASSLLKPGPSSLSFKPPKSIEVITLDNWAAENFIPRIDFLWISASGHEIDIFQASPHIISTIKVIIVDVHIHNYYEHGKSYHEIKDWLENNNFSLAWAARKSAHEAIIIFTHK